MLTLLGNSWWVVDIFSSRSRASMWTHGSHPILKRAQRSAGSFLWWFICKAPDAPFQILLPCSCKLQVISNAVCGRHQTFQILNVHNFFSYSQYGIFKKENLNYKFNSPWYQEIKKLKKRKKRWTRVRKGKKKDLEVPASCEEVALAWLTHLRSLWLF